MTYIAQLYVSQGTKECNVRVPSVMSLSVSWFIMREWNVIRTYEDKLLESIPKPLE
jgi:hypothetical protein